MQPYPLPGVSRARADAQDLARSAMETRAQAAELRIIAHDIRLRAQAERGRARLLALGAEEMPAAADGAAARYAHLRKIRRDRAALTAWPTGLFRGQSGSRYR